MGKESKVRERRLWIWLSPPFFQSRVSSITIKSDKILTLWHRSLCIRRWNRKRVLRLRLSKFQKSQGRRNSDTAYSRPTSSFSRDICDICDIYVRDGSQAASFQNIKTAFPCPNNSYLANNAIVHKRRCKIKREKDMIEMYNKTIFVHKNGCKSERIAIKQKKNRHYFFSSTLK